MRKHPTPTHDTYCSFVRRGSTSSDFLDSSIAVFWADVKDPDNYPAPAPQYIFDTAHQQDHPGNAKGHEGLIGRSEQIHADFKFDDEDVTFIHCDSPDLDWASEPFDWDGFFIRADPSERYAFESTKTETLIRAANNAPEPLRRLRRQVVEGIADQAAVAEALKNVSEEVKRYIVQAVEDGRGREWSGRVKQAVRGWGHSAREWSEVAWRVAEEVVAVMPPLDVPVGDVREGTRR